jgi:predicted protein tyrosine phosphatase
MKKDYYIVAIVSKETDEIVSVQACVCKSEIQEIIVNDDYAKIVIVCDKTTAKKMLKKFRKSLDNEIKVCYN